MKLLSFFITILLSMPSYSDSCEQGSEVVLEDPSLMTLTETRISEKMVQIDISVPVSIDGRSVQSAQLLQMDEEKPFFLILLSLPFPEGKRATTQIFSAPNMFSGGEVQVWYKSSECPTLLSGTIT